MEITALCCNEGLDRAGIRRRRIVEAARMLFADNGFHATGVAQIAKASGVAVGQLYRDFGAKEDIVADIVEGDCVRFVARESLSHAIETGDRDTVVAWLHQFVEPTGKNDSQQLFAEIIAESARNPRIADIVARMRIEVSETMLSALAFLAPGDDRAASRDRLAELILTQSLGLKQQRLMNPAADLTRLTAVILKVIDREIAALETAARMPA